MRKGIREWYGETRGMLKQMLEAQGNKWETLREAIWKTLKGSYEETHKGNYGETHKGTQGETH